MSDTENDNENQKVVSLAGARESKDKHKDKPDDGKKKAEEAPKEGVIECSFCLRTNKEVIKMINGPGVNICSECTLICMQYFMFEDKVPQDEAKALIEKFWQMTR